MLSHGRWALYSIWYLYILFQHPSPSYLRCERRKEGEGSVYVSSSFSTPLSCAPVFEGEEGHYISTTIVTCKSSLGHIPLVSPFAHKFRWPFYSFSILLSSPFLQIFTPLVPPPSHRIILICFLLPFPSPRYLSLSLVFSFSLWKG